MLWTVMLQSEAADVLSNTINRKPKTKKHCWHESPVRCRFFRSFCACCSKKGEMRIFKTYLIHKLKLILERSFAAEQTQKHRELFSSCFLHR